MHYQADSRVYELDESWGKLPKGHEFHQVAGVAVDKQDRVYLYNRSAHKLMVFDRDGRFLTAWKDEFTTPHGICVGPDGNVYLADTGAHVVHKYTPDGRHLMTMGTKGKPSDTGVIRDFLVQWPGIPFNMVTGVAVAQNGDIFASDGYGNCRVHKFNAEGRLLASWGIPGKAWPLEFHLPHGLAIDPRGRLLVCDRESDRIQVLDQNGKFLAMWTGFRLPCSLTVSPDGLVFVAELRHRVSVVDLEGRILANWGGESSHEPGRFVAPHTVAVDSHGDVYVGEVLEGKRVQKFVRK